MVNIFLLAITAVLIENFVFVKFLGICPFIGVSKKISTAVGMGIAVIFTMTVSSALTWPVHYFLLQPFDLSYFDTIAFILIIAAVVQLVEMYLRKCIPSLYSALGIYLPLITTNCAVLGISLLNVTKGYNFIESVLYGFFSGVGFLLAIVLLSLVRERIKFADIPTLFRGVPIVLIAAAILSIAFMGFQGLKLPF